MTASPDVLILATTPLTAHRDAISAERVRAIVDAAADAGFAGVSIWSAHHDFAVADGMPSEAYYDYHGERGLAVPASEVVIDWSTPERAKADDNVHVLDVSARAGASTVIAASIEADVPPLAAAAAGLAALCDLAADRGMSISLEFMPFGGVLSIARAAQLIEAADRDNLGLVLDAWHWSRQSGGPDLTTLRSIPAERIHLFQLNDAAPEPAQNLMGESMHRLLPGAGAVDLLGLLGVLDEMGASPVIATEVFSVDLAGLEPAENARRQHAAATALLERHRERSSSAA